jgi:MFS family permease
MARQSLAQTLATLRSGRECPGLLRFLIGRVFYTDPINTVISFMTLFTVNVAMHAGLDRAAGEKRAQYIMLFAITFAIAGGFFWGRMTDWFGPRRTLNWVLRSWMGIFILAACTGLFGLPLWVMAIVAASAGFALGGVWAADRPYMLRLTPPERIGEFYGLYGMVGRFSAITGPMLWGIVTHLAVKHAGFSPLTAQGLAVLTLLTLTIISYVILQPVSDAPRDWNAGKAGASAETDPPAIAPEPPGGAPASGTARLAELTGAVLEAGAPEPRSGAPVSKPARSDGESDAGSESGAPAQGEGGLKPGEGMVPEENAPRPSPPSPPPSSTGGPP